MCVSLYIYVCRDSDAAPWPSCACAEPDFERLSEKQDLKNPQTLYKINVNGLEMRISTWLLCRALCSGCDVCRSDVKMAIL